MSDLFAHLNANTNPPADDPPTLAELEAMLAATPDDAELQTYVEHRRKVEGQAAVAPKPTRIADLPPPLALDLEPAPPSAAPNGVSSATLAEGMADFDAQHAKAMATLDEPKPRRTRGPNKPKVVATEQPLAPAYDQALAMREHVVIECLRAGLDFTAAKQWIAIVEGGDR